MRWSSRAGDLAKLLFVGGTSTPDCSLQRLTANLSGSNPYTTPLDVNAPPAYIDRNFYESRPKIGERA
jgi:hypothetical protein